MVAAVLCFMQLHRANHENETTNIAFERAILNNIPKTEINKNDRLYFTSETIVLYKI